MNDSFCTSYFTARSYLLKKAESASLSHLQVSYPARGPNGEELSIDFLYAGPKDASKVLLHVSGIHGVEGYAGALVQDRIYGSHQFKDSSCGVVFVLCANPYGMSWVRRTNFENVDLNRSYFAGRDREQMQNYGYRYFSKLLAPDSKLQQIKGVFEALYWARKIGKNEMVQAISGGQKEFPQGLFYCGLKNPIEIVTIRKTVAHLFPKIKNLYAIDVHTGLGPFLGETLYGDQEITEEHLEFFSRVIKKPVVQSSKDEGSYENKGYWSRGLRDETTWNVFYFLQEFGTENLFRVLKSLQRENYQHFYGDSKADKTKFKGVFFPDSLKWRENLMDIGHLRFQQVFDEIQS